MSSIQPHIECAEGDIADIVLLPGNPQRVEVIANFLDSHKKVAENREYKTVTGEFNGTPVSITSTGIGCPSTAIAVEELILCGAKTLIRVGTCGSAWRKDIQPLDVIIPTASVRDEGTTKEYMPEGFPAVATVGVVNALQKSATEQEINHFMGINRTHDAFYAPDRSVAKWGEFYKDERFKDMDSPIISSEMEVSALFVLASMLGVRAGAVLAVDADPTPLKTMALREDYMPNEAYRSIEISKQAQENMIKTALGSLQYLS